LPFSLALFFFLVSIIACQKASNLRRLFFGNPRFFSFRFRKAK
jgi:hypothetical protein